MTEGTVLEQGLSDADPIPFTDQKPGHDPAIVLSEKRRGGRVAPFRDPRCGRSADLEIQTPANPEMPDRYRSGHGSSMLPDAAAPAALSVFYSDGSKAGGQVR